MGDNKYETIARLIHEQIGKKALALRYVNQKGEESRRVVIPQAVTRSIDGFWGFIGYCTLRNETRWFRVERIKNMDPVPMPEMPEPVKKPDIPSGTLRLQCAGTTEAVNRMKDWRGGLALGASLDQTQALHVLRALEHLEGLDPVLQEARERLMNRGRRPTLREKMRRREKKA